ncbi:hypothetical protein BDZ97DRAFT_1784780 [Flammula alnicola]|nr:hypothetical protein BDZ97DRAFT_1784780 [Flammula alnicola]
MSIGNSGLLGGHFLTRQRPNDLHLNLKGGQAYADSTNELKRLKYQAHRFFVQFFDISPQLLIPSLTANSLLDNDWPDPFLGFIHSVELAPEALNFWFITKHRFDLSHLRPKSWADTEIVLLDRVYSRPGSRLVPFPGVSYKDGSLIIVDMRGPKTSFQVTGTRTKSTLQAALTCTCLWGRSFRFHHGPGPDIIKSLTWTVSPLEKDPQLSVRLIASHQSGHADVYTLTHSGNPISWSISGEHNAVPQCFYNVGAKEIGKVEWGNKVGMVQSSQVVEHMGSRALVVQTDRHDALLPPVTSLPMTIDDTGDFIARDSSQPQPVSLGPASLLGSWFSFKQTLTVGGPNRPIPEKIKAERDKSAGEEGVAGAAGATAAGFAAGAAAVQANIYNRLTSVMSERGTLQLTGRRQ